MYDNIDNIITLLHLKEPIISFPKRLKQLDTRVFAQVAIFYLTNMEYEINTCALMQLFMVIF